MKAFLSKGREYGDKPVVAGHIGQNSDLIRDVARLYIPDNAFVMDMTWGKGSFWAKTDTTRFDLFGTDIKDLEIASPCVPLGDGTYTHDPRGKARGLYGNTDFRELVDLGNVGIDVVVFDPPYKSGGSTTHESMVGQYGLQHLDSDRKSKHGDVGRVRQYYRDGIDVAYQLLTSSGLLLAKCQDMVESGKQHWMHVWVKEEAERQGFTAKDLFVLTTSKRPMMRHKTQHHARKNVSYLWVFQK